MRTAEAAPSIQGVGHQAIFGGKQMSDETKVSDVPGGFKISGPDAAAFGELIKEAAREMGIELPERNGCIVIEKPQQALWIFRRAKQLIDERSK
jgi:hypothetical protein